MSQFPSLPDEANPYAAPEADLSPDIGDRELIGEAEAIRREYQKHEANVRSIGLLYYLSAGFLGITSAAMIILGFQVARQRPLGDPGQLSREFPAFIATVGIVVGLIALLNVALGFGIRRLRGWARWLSVVQAALGIAVIGLGLLSQLATVGPQGGMLGQIISIWVSSYILSLLLSPQSRVIFAPEYQEVIAQTPEIRTGTSPLVKFLLIIVGALFLLALVGGVVGGLIRAES